jgi:thiamine transport system substrate-binding protein
MKNKVVKAVFVLLVMVLVLSACSAPEAAESVEPAVLTVMTHDSFAASEEVIAGFEAEHSVELRFVKAGDTGAALNKAILSKSAPLADVFFGVDNNFLSRALEEDLFVAYHSPLLEEIPDSFELDSEHRVLPVDYGDVCINYDKAYFAEKELAVPASLDDLTKPEYAELLAVENPATSSPGLAFLLATIAEYGDPGYLDYWAALRENGVMVVSDWETAYYGNFSASSGQGPQPMVVSYGSSPPAEVIFAETELSEAPTASLVGENMCYRQVEFVGILKGTEQQDLAEQFIDFMLGQTFQEDVPMQMFVFPVNESAALPEEFVAYAQIPEQPAQLDSADITANREAWITAWDEVVLR